MRTHIIPEVSFTCSGTVTGWRAAGEIRVAGGAMINSVLSIWRERSSGSGIYDRVSGIELGICGDEDPAPLVMSNIYECILPQMVSVQPGYIVGIELPSENHSKFRLYFNSQGEETSYVFDGHGTTFSLSQAIYSELDQPQISLTIVPDIYIATTVLPTIQPSTTTEVSSTMAGHPTTLPLTSTSMATVYTTEFPTQSTTDQAPTAVPSTEAPTPPPIDSRATPQDPTSDLTSTSIDLATLPQSGSGDNSVLVGGIIGAVSAIATLVPLFLIVTIFLVLLTKRRSQRLYNVPTPQPQTDIDSTIYSQIIDSQSIEMKNNEAYSLSLPLNKSQWKIM